LLRRGICHRAGHSGRTHWLLAMGTNDRCSSNRESGRPWRRARISCRRAESFRDALQVQGPVAAHGGIELVHPSEICRGHRIEQYFQDMRPGRNRLRLDAEIVGLAAIGPAAAEVRNCLTNCFFKSPYIIFPPRSRARSTDWGDANWAERYGRPNGRSSNSTREFHSSLVAKSHCAGIATRH
jgi:hypothetical protein